MKQNEENTKKTPDLLAIKSKRVPLSTRVKVESKNLLESAAKRANTSVSDLTAAIIDDYCEWLGQHKAKKMGKA